jgi:hypothetical protein
LLAKERGKLAAAVVPPSLPEALRRRLEQAVDLAFVDAFRLVMLLAAGLAVAAAGVAWLLIARRNPIGRVRP